MKAQERDNPMKRLLPYLAGGAFMLSLSLLPVAEARAEIVGQTSANTTTHTNGYSFNEIYQAFQVTATSTLNAVRLKGDFALDRTYCAAVRQGSSAVDAYSTACLGSGSGDFGAGYGVMTFEGYSAELYPGVAYTIQLVQNRPAGNVQPYMPDLDGLHGVAVPALNDDYCSGATHTTGSEDSLCIDIGGEPGGFLWFQVFTGTDEPGEVEPDDTSTRIVSFLPEFATTTATSSIALGAEVYVNEDDFEEGMKLRIKATSPEFGQGAGLAHIAFPSSGFPIYSLFVGNEAGEWEFPIEAAGSSSFSTTTAVSYIGRYDVVYEIYRPQSLIDSYLPFLSGGLLGFNPFGVFTSDPSVLDSESSYFIAVERTAINKANDYITAANDAFVNNTASSTSEFVEACSIWSTSGTVVDCLTVMLVPSKSQLSDLMASARDGFLSRAPFGYLTRMASIMATSSTSTLPCVPVSVVNETFDALLGADVGASDLCFEGKVMGPGSILAEAESIGDDPKTLWEIVEEPWTWLWRLALLAYIVYRLVGSHIFHGPSKPFQEMSGQEGVSDESYRLKETLYRMSKRK